ncbi:hypothetical protein COCNU_scaffold005780G000010 [Cocos nucifera]|nr:hypothetical protein [Cocos nucifera]
MGYAQFSIRGAVGAYSIHLDIDCLGTSIACIYSTSDIYSTDGIYSIGASSSWIFYGPIRTAHMWNCQHQRRYDFSDHERARDARLRKIEKLYRDYKVKLHRGWLEHQ